MLLLVRKELEDITVRHLGEELTIRMVDINGNRATIGLHGPKSFEIVRSEVDSKRSQAAVVDSQ